MSVKLKAEKSFTEGNVIIVNGVAGMIKQFNPDGTVTVFLEEVIKLNGGQTVTNMVVAEPIVGFKVVKLL